jgi:hypothetical protein
MTNHAFQAGNVGRKLYEVHAFVYNGTRTMARTVLPGSAGHCNWVCVARRYGDMDRKK